MQSIEVLLYEVGRDQGIRIGMDLKKYASDSVIFEVDTSDTEVINVILFCMYYLIFNIDYENNITELYFCIYYKCIICLNNTYEIN